ncbi:hypothetical protein AN958_01510 [Leucoagaricus sp. SymC.cos]|nr:hypothetical protein AN958_01510 [Leucoagaricus sp. SymC.cos]
MITFFDLASVNGNSLKTWSPNPWKTRYVLNYKKLSYKTVYLEYPELEPELKKLGIPPSTNPADGTALYTSPSIVDEANKKQITDSYKIAEYLDKAYPDTPQVIPKGTEALQAALYDHLDQLIMPYWPLLLPILPPRCMNPPSAEYFTRTRSAWFGKPLADLEPQGEARTEAWKKVEASFDTINGWLSKSSGPYLMGETVTFSDFVLGGFIQSIKLCFGEESEEWKKVQVWNGGRWKAYLASLEPYAAVEK